MSTTPQFNRADLQFLSEALEALDAAAGLSNVAAVRGSAEEVRALAQWTLTAQRRLMEALQHCLVGDSAGDPSSARPIAVRPPTRPATDHLRNLQGPALDEAFVIALTAHADRSLVRARAEMVAGLNGDARGIAELAIRKLTRELAALDRLGRLALTSHLLAPRARTADAVTDWENEGGHLAPA